MDSPDAALAYTAKEGWHALPAPRVMRAVKDRRKDYRRPQPKDDPDLTYRLMVEAGYSQDHAERVAYRKRSQ